jgi:hypothetical protein
MGQLYSTRMHSSLHLGKMHQCRRKLPRRHEPFQLSEVLNRREKALGGQIQQTENRGNWYKN